MKTINIGTNASTYTSPSTGDPSDRQPCWYADLLDTSPKSKAKWIVGVKDVTKGNEEYSFKISKIGSVSDSKLWSYATSADFAIKLINKYKSGGKKSVNDWIKKGCK